MIIMCAIVDLSPCRVKSWRWDVDCGFEMRVCNVLEDLIDVHILLAAGCDQFQVKT